MRETRRSNLEIGRQKLLVKVVHRPLPSLRHGLHVRDSILPGRLFLELLGSHSQHRLLGQHLLVGERGLGGEYVGEVGGAPAQVL